MTISEMIEIKKAKGLSNNDIAEMSGVPLGTVQKIFSGNTGSPRFQTLQALERALSTQLVMEHREYGAKKSSSESYNFGTAAKVTADDMTGKTLDDYLALPEGTRIEMIDGTFYDMAAPTFIHQRIGALICFAFESFINANGGLCVPSVAPTDVQLDCDDKTMVQPDVLVVCDRNKIIKARVVGAPDLIVEVLSPNNWYMDTMLKMKKYKNAGVREYWIVLPEQKSVIVYNFEISSEYTEYTFEDKVPVAIWDNKCEVDFKFIYDKISFLYE